VRDWLAKRSNICLCMFAGSRRSSHKCTRNGRGCVASYAWQLLKMSVQSPAHIVFAPAAEAQRRKALTKQQAT
jgi:hypothetical protein